MKKGSLFTRFFSRELRRQTATGNIDLLKKRYLEISQTCKPPLKEKPLGYEKLCFLFLILISGYIMSILIVILEYANQNKKIELENATKNKKISLIEEKIEKYLEGFSLPNLEMKDILSELNQKFIKKHRQLISRRNTI